MTSTSPPKKARSPEEIEKDLAAVRARFTSTLDELSVRVQPDELGQDVSAVASSAAGATVDKAKEWAGLGETGPRPELIGALAGAGLAIVILLVRSRRSTVTYEFLLPNDKVSLDEVLVRATGRKVPSGLGGAEV